jgi:hypothetical protein
MGAQGPIPARQRKTKRRGSTPGAPQQQSQQPVQQQQLATQGTVTVCCVGSCSVLFVAFLCVPWMRKCELNARSSAYRDRLHEGASCVGGGEEEEAMAQFRFACIRVCAVGCWRMTRSFMTGCVSFLACVGWCVVPQCLRLFLSCLFLVYHRSASCSSRCCSRWSEANQPTNDRSGSQG